MDQVLTNPARIIASALQGGVQAAAAKLGLSSKQVSAIRGAPPGRRAALLRGFVAQGPAGKEAKPGKTAPKKAALFAGAPVIPARIAPRGQGFYDAFATPLDTVATAMSIGLATPILGRSRDLTIRNSPSSNISDNSVLIWFQPGHAHNYAGRQFAIDHTNGGLTERNLIVPQFSSLYDNVSGVGVEQITVRGSIRIRNVTEARNVGGVVRVLRYGGGYPVPTDAASYMSLCDMIRDSPHTNTYSGHELVTTKQKNCYIVDQARATTFESDSAFSGGASRSATGRPYLTQIFILIDTFSPGDTVTAASGMSVTYGLQNSYELSVAVQRLARFDPGTLMHSLTRSIPADPHMHNQARDREEASGSSLTHVLEMGASAVNWLARNRESVAAAAKLL